MKDDDDKRLKEHAEIKTMLEVIENRQKITDNPNKVEKVVDRLKHKLVRRLTVRSKKKIEEVIDAVVDKAEADSMISDKN